MSIKTPIVLFCGLLCKLEFATYTNMNTNLVHKIRLALAESITHVASKFDECALDQDGPPTKSKWTVGEHD